METAISAPTPCLDPLLEGRHCSHDHVGELAEHVVVCPIGLTFAQNPKPPTLGSKYSGQRIQEMSKRRMIWELLICVFLQRAYEVIMQSTCQGGIILAAASEPISFQARGRDSAVIVCGDGVGVGHLRHRGPLQWTVA